MKLSKADKEFVEFSKNNWKIVGLDDLSSTIIGILFVEPEPIAMEDIAKLTGYSLASISNKVRQLEIHQMIKRVSKPKSRKAFYYMDKNFLGMVKKNLERNNQMNELTLKELPNIINLYEKEKNVEKKNILIKYQENVVKIDKLIKEGLKFLETLK